jgi:hypothetical protein
LSYLEPPPAPNPVVVVKDVGGLVADYQKRTEFYRQTNREVQLHECRSACTMALSLPNVCVFPDSTLKFHQAYNWDTKVRDLGVSDQLFSTYPAAVRARLGTLTREYRVLRGSDLIALGVRDCTAPHPSEPKIMVASAKPQPLPAAGSSGDLSISGLVHGVMTAFDRPVLSNRPPESVSTTASGAPAAKPLPPSDLVFADLPTPPPRPQELDAAVPTLETAALIDVPLPPRRPMSLQVAYVRRMPVIALPRIITGAHPILPSGFSAYAAMSR